ncbi:glycosyltransferase family 2 protein [Vibrio parahaemolyticus]|uniref:glycosyltransferase family 2 protein n=1 Tax=Vibrio parahaemolyticus TaxID=670 RepID=UPI0011ED6CF6|nr:glycosyltransferase family A protein [Vibrio parahaemolyticus]QEL41603.1 glycosyltransferase family 2 protein [Vibrio parahaemolyticus]
MVKISFIVPCYNVANYIENSLLRWEPLLSQNVEFIFINDGSRDDTLITLERSLKDTSFNSKIITVPNQGVSSARNLGLSEAVGDYVVFLDSDDYFENGYLNFIYDTLSSSQELDLIITNFDMVDDIGNQIRSFKSSITSISEPLMQYLKGDITCHIGSLCINRNFLVEHDIKFPIGVAVGEDLIFTVKLFECAVQDRIKIFNISFFRYVVNSSSVMNSEISMKHYEGIEKNKVID